MNPTELRKHQSRSNRSVVEPAAHAPVADGATRAGGAPDTGAVGDGTTHAGGPIPDFLAVVLMLPALGGQDALMGALNGCIHQLVS
ncbi:hypothetical protein C2845_PM09G19420 [Panicum miliaceum]|uniref:Uncharacterized protein n=1 Tax=Panicum miliaceum TaxID=4540 RepID=A0A3L6S4M3_PANMI|nr:hypothetical protein C2845_PM09G19420 [Panicum miliaceum]